ncbi:MAG: hypothetical protein PUP91_34875 [Rhizonema sp. PD37]|nr:hypothetical protein [Rhizonema sp. PD37]
MLAETHTIKMEVDACHTMHEISPLDAIDRQLEDLTLQQLLSVRVKIDEIIQKKTVSASGNQDIISHLSKEISPVFAATYIQLIEQKKDKNNSLDHVSNLVCEWMQEESEYDAERTKRILSHVFNPIDSLGTPLNQQPTMRIFIQRW